ncbi:MAG: phage head closure protein [Alphaproteobacteria bacterium]|nr:phage head closure protein [Alphaproteobacteria bacterium]
MLGSINLNELIIIEEQESRPDSMGGYKKEWFSKYVIWARFLPLYNKKQLGNEVAVSKQIQSVNFYEFTIRYREGITNKMRIKHKSRSFEVIKVIESSNKRFLEVIAKEII